MGFAVFGLLTPPVLLAVLVALGRYEELMLPHLRDEPEGPEGSGGAQDSGDVRGTRDGG
jgi:hypothetical protein